MVLDRRVQGVQVSESRPILVTSLSHFFPLGNTFIKESRGNKDRHTHLNTLSSLTKCEHVKILFDSLKWPHLLVVGEWTSKCKPLVRTLPFTAQM